MRDTIDNDRELQALHCVEIPVQGDHLPHYATEGASGADVRAYLEEPIEMAPGETAAIPTGLWLDLPPGYEIQVRPRSGLAYKYGVTVLNTPGTIDSDYRGEIKIILINHGRCSFVVEPGMRIAQLVLAPIIRARFVPAHDALTTSARGEGGFGHTGLQ